MSEKLKREFIELLEKDVEFRYTVAGYLGLSEVLKRMDKMEERMLALEERMLKLEEGQNKLWGEVKGLRENQNKLWENQNRLWEEVRDMRITLNRVAVTLDRLTISVEEEALSFIRHNVRDRLGIDIPLDRVFIDSKEINIYGASGDLCVVGEATARLGTNIVEELIEKVNLIKSKRPELMRKRLIKVIYADYATPDAIRLAREKNIWVVKWSGDLTSLKIEEVQTS
ncbi:hypothetical protein HRbin02_01082 [Candidatus Calditenuaceae archaeon HR02]|nr:hypothetical protein HRbin02_01082 [Candidatus Calditenuaceae archaeon HR02]